MYNDRRWMRAFVMTRITAVVILGWLHLGLADEIRDDVDVENVDAVSRHHRALELYDAGEFALALIEFERAYLLTANFKTLYNIAQVQAQLGHYAKARQAFEDYLARGNAGISEMRRDEVRRELATLRLRTAYVSVYVNIPRASVTINGVAAGETPLAKMLVDAGALRINVSKDGFTSHVRELTLAGGDHYTLRIALAEMRGSPKQKAPEGRMPTLATAGWVVSGVLAATTVGFGIAALHASSRYEDARSADIVGTAAQAKEFLESERSKVRTLSLATDILAASTLVLGGAALYLTLAGRRSSLNIHGLGARFEARF
jgi:tetratricopeptide (TPR) repeat protein